MRASCPRRSLSQLPHAVSHEHGRRKAALDHTSNTDVVPPRGKPKPPEDPRPHVERLEAACSRQHDIDARGWPCARKDISNSSYRKSLRHAETCSCQFRKQRRRVRQSIAACKLTGCRKSLCSACGRRRARAHGMSSPAGLGFHSLRGRKNGKEGYKETGWHDPLELRHDSPRSSTTERQRTRSVRVHLDDEVCHLRLLDTDRSKHQIANSTYLPSATALPDLNTDNYRPHARL